MTNTNADDSVELLVDFMSMRAFSQGNGKQTLDDLCVCILPLIQIDRSYQPSKVTYTMANDTRNGMVSSILPKGMGFFAKEVGNRVNA